ncbi:unnamed protein product [Auanema sp. JU1783]|nr:unnamed protein product [Auanema sp. JU1783]
MKTLLGVLLSLSIVIQTDAQSAACLANDLTPAEQKTCDNINMWNVESSKIDAILSSSRLPSFGGLTSGPVLASNGPALPSDMYDCLTIQCICNFIEGASYNSNGCRLPDGQIMGKVVRKELRMLTESERSAYATAFQSVAGTNGIYRTLSGWHSSTSTSPAAHSGPAFLPWHREFIKRLEIGIRTLRVNGAFPYVNLAVPYWDSTLDDDLRFAINNSPTNSIMFSNVLMGSVLNGLVSDGYFGSFSGTQGRVRRRLDQYNGQTTVFRSQDVGDIVTYHQIENLLAATSGSSLSGCNYNRSALEFRHGDVHVWVGGHMETTTTSTNDPIFFMHHAFVDKIWEDYRQQRQTRSQRESQYNTRTNCYNNNHRINAVMTPFRLFVVEDGLSNRYTDELYSYDSRPTCGSDNSNCGGSEFLFCNTNLRRCTSKIKPGGVCRRIGTVDPCYASTCSSTSTTSFGTCRAPARDAPRSDNKYPIVEHKLDERCYNNHPCCAQWASQGECQKKKFAAVMSVACPASCGNCKPTAYKLQDTCDNRHKLCKIYKSQGACSKNANWMSENCRRECGLCASTRAQSCDGGKSGYKKNSKPASDTPRTHLPPPPPPPHHSLVSKPHKGSHVGKTGKCFNENMCCRVWAEKGGCQTKKSLMTRVCQASCVCTPYNDNNSCSDFATQCPLYASKGLCWLEFMKENCRKSCRSCHTMNELRGICKSQELYRRG